MQRSGVGTGGVSQDSRKDSRQDHSAVRRDPRKPRGSRWMSCSQISLCSITRSELIPTGKFGTPNQLQGHIPPLTIPNSSCQDQGLNPNKSKEQSLCYSQVLGGSRGWEFFPKANSLGTPSHRSFPTSGMLFPKTSCPSSPGPADHGCDAGPEDVHGSQGGKQPAAGDADPAPRSHPDPGSGAIEGREGAAGGTGTLRPVPPVPTSTHQCPPLPHLCRRLERSQIPGMPSSGEAGGAFTTLRNFGGFLPTFHFSRFFWGWFFFLVFSGLVFPERLLGKLPGTGLEWGCGAASGAGEGKNIREKLWKGELQDFCSGVATGTARIPHGNIPEDEGAIGSRLEGIPAALPVGFWGILVGIFPRRVSEWKRKETGVKRVRLC